MATGNVIVTVVDVGQGQCTFVEIYDDDGMAPTLLQTLLFDCGSDKRSTQTRNNLNYIAERIATMAEPRFDCIFFSHSDNDHISLMWYLIAEINRRLGEDDEFTIGKIVYGGAWRKYTKRRKNILDYIYNQGLCDEDNIISPGSNFSDYNPLTRTYTGSLWESEDGSVIVRALAINVLSSDPDWTDNGSSVEGATAEELNRVSLVAGLYYANRSYIICGDATNDTMSAIIKRFNNIPVGFFNGNNMTTLPHHGSRITGYAVQGAQQASLKSMFIVTGFADLLKSQTITVSAYRKHSHPSLYLMADFIPLNKIPLIRDPRLQQNNAHRVTANIDFRLTADDGIVVRQDDDQSFETTVNTFSTNYYIGYQTFSYRIGGLFVYTSEGLVPPAAPINPFACWQYTSLPDGNYNLVGYPNLNLPLAAFTAAPQLPPVHAPQVYLHGLHDARPSFTGTRRKPKQKRPITAISKPLFNHGLQHFL